MKVIPFVLWLDFFYFRWIWRLRLWWLLATEYWLSLMLLSCTLFVVKCHSPEIGLTAFLLNFTIQMDGIEGTQILLIIFKAFQEMRLIIAWAICHSYFIPLGVEHTIKKFGKMSVCRPFFVMWSLKSHCLCFNTLTSHFHFSKSIFPTLEWHMYAFIPLTAYCARHG